MQVLVVDIHPAAYQMYLRVMHGLVVAMMSASTVKLNSDTARR